MTIVWRDLGLIFLIPVIFAFVLSNFEINYILGTVSSIILSYLALLKFGIIKKNDVQDSMTVFPGKISRPLINVVDKIASKLNQNY